MARGRWGKSDMRRYYVLASVAVAGAGEMLVEAGWLGRA